MRRITTAILLVGIVANCDATVQPNEQPAPYFETLWLDPGHEHPLFLPEGVLRTADIAGLPLSEGSRDILAQQVEQFRKAQENSCNQPSRTQEQGTLRESISIEEMLADTEVVVVGTVMDIIDGWSPWTNKVSKIAYISVSEVLSGSELEGAPETGDLVGILFQGGTTLVAGTVICTQPVEGLYEPRQGDKLLVGGDPWPADDRYFNARPTFQIVGDDVLSQPYSNLRKDQARKALGELRLSLREKGKGKRSQ